MASFYVTYHLEKIINKSYWGFDKKTFTEMSYEVQKCMVFDWNELGYDIYIAKNDGMGQYLTHWCILVVE